ncbi:MAG: 50S ribosomal protein L30e [Nanoarchaeota archaeon]|nr:50S ribosomal protein L30e [Nanoarchaeota archaeon]
MSQISEIKTALKDGKAVLGWNKIERLIKSGAVKKLFVSVKSSEKVLEDVSYYSKIGGFVVEEFAGDTYELGVLCKKPFPVSVLGVKE